MTNERSNPPRAWHALQASAALAHLGCDPGIGLSAPAAALGAFAWGYAQDQIGHIRALGITLAGWIVMTVLAALATGPGLFWVAAVIAGLCMGSSQSAGRALAGLFSPAAQRAEFYGLWTFAIRLSAIIGPLTYGLITLLSAGNHRLAIASTGVYFVLGLLLLMQIDVPRGVAAAEAAGSDSIAAGAPPS